MNKRFAFALEHLELTDWERFEKTASIFLSTEYPNIRSVGCPSGDGGRDAELFSSSSDPSVLVQYSITPDWKAKIYKTAKRVSENFKGAQVIIYATNQTIGANADSVKAEIKKKYGYFLDIRDRGWFTERESASQANASAASDLSKEITDRYLASKNIISGMGQPLNSVEARAAFVYLELQWQDEKDKGLTRLSFEALIKAALRDTDSDHKLTRPLIHEKISEMLPEHPRSQVIKYTDEALMKMPKGVLRHWKKDDEFCLSFEERERIKIRLIDAEAANLLLYEKILEALTASIEANNAAITAELFKDRVRRVLESFLMQRGEFFASSAMNGDMQQVDEDLLRSAIISDIGANPFQERNTNTSLLIKIICTTVTKLLLSDDPVVQKYIRELADAYTLLAFLRETADIQSAVSKMFSNGEIWLDTSVVLPLLAENLQPDAELQIFSNMLKTALLAGIKLHITEGVLEELDSHMRIALNCARSMSWDGRVPFLYSAFLLAGGSPEKFPGWINKFRGDSLPEQDIADYLSDQFEISVDSLTDEYQKSAFEMKAEVEATWYEKRQNNRETTDDITIQKLVQHDLENFLGVLEKRKTTKVSPVGYSEWWLTLDKTAFEISRELSKKIKSYTSPVMSIDFLINYLTFGPIRTRTNKKAELLPIAFELSKLDSLPPELIKTVGEIRTQYRDKDERVIAREVRDAINKAKSRQGEATRAGLRGVEQAISDSTKNGRR